MALALDPLTAILDTGKTVLDKILPDKMSEKERMEVTNHFTVEMFKAATAREGGFRKFILEYEGRAAEYAKIRFFGPLLLLVRGMIRPAFTIATGYWDYLYFTSDTDWGQAKSRLLFAITVIVLIFWFGERAVKYIMPFLKEFLNVRGQGSGSNQNAMRSDDGIGTFGK